MRCYLSILLCTWLLFAIPPGSEIRFELTRLPAKLQNHPSQKKYLPETMAGGIAAFDYDGDGRIDLFFTNGASLPALQKGTGDENHLFHNDGNFHFRDVTAESGLTGTGYSVGAAAADYDNDGRPDLFVTGVNGNHLYHNDGGGHFSDVTGTAGVSQSEWSVGAAWLDYDRDGLLDLLVVNYVVFPGDDSPACTETAQSISVYCHPDKFKGLPNRLFHNAGNGHFEDVSAASGIGRYVGKGMAATTADFDADGYPDVFVTYDTLPNFLFHNLRDGKFEEIALDAGVALADTGRPVSGMGAQAADYDNDGRPDIAFTALSGQTFPLFHNLGHNTFEDAGYASRLSSLSIRRSGWGLAFADLDNDGWKDLVSANSHVTDNVAAFSGDRYQLPNSIFRNLGQGHFEDISQLTGADFQVARPHRALAVADLDNDGRLDLVVSVLGQEPELWRNQTRNQNHWIGVQLTGKTSNRNGLGARIEIAGQLALLESAQGYASSVLGAVHLGLGKMSQLPPLTVRWPSGKTQVVTNPRVDSIIKVAEQ